MRIVKQIVPPIVNLLFVLAAPVLYAMYEAGGTAMAIWIGFCQIFAAVSLLASSRSGRMSCFDSKSPNLTRWSSSDTWSPARVRCSARNERRWNGVRPIRRIARRCSRVA